MDALAECASDLRDPRQSLIAELCEHALVIGEVTLTGGARAQYYVDAKRAILRPRGFAAVSALLAAQAGEWGATAVGGMSMGADPLACAALAGGEDVVTTGGSTIEVIDVLRDAGLAISGVASVLDRLVGGRAAIERAAAAPYVALSTIDDVYPERPDREQREPASSRATG